MLESEKIDLVILDLMLPEMSGPELCRWMKANRRTQLVPVLMVTSIAAMFCLPVRAQLTAEQAGWAEKSTILSDHPVNIVACNSDWIAIGDEHNLRTDALGAQ